MRRKKKEKVTFFFFPFLLLVQQKYLESLWLILEGSFSFYVYKLQAVVLHLFRFCAASLELENKLIFVFVLLGEGIHVCVFHSCMVEMPIPFFSMVLY